MKKNKIGYFILFVLPTFILYTVFIIYPIFMAIYYSMTKWNGMSEPIFIWFNNYIKLIGDNNYWIIIKNSGILIAVSLVFQIPFALFLAYLVYKTKKGAKFFRSVFFIPVIITPTAIAMMFTLFFNSELGPINLIFKRLGLDFLQMNWLSDSRTVLFAVIIPLIWEFIGFYFVIYLAAIYTIPQEIFESAEMDGSSSIKTFIHIVIPMLADVIGVTAVLLTVISLRAFVISYMMTWGGPGVMSSFLGLYVYQEAFQNSNFGYGSTVGVTVLIIAFIFTILLKRFISRQSY